MFEEWSSFSKGTFAKLVGSHALVTSLPRDTNREVCWSFVSLEAEIRELYLYFLSVICELKHCSFFYLPKTKEKLSQTMRRLTGGSDATKVCLLITGLQPSQLRMKMTWRCDCRQVATQLLSPAPAGTGTYSPLPPSAPKHLSVHGRPAKQETINH